MTTIINTPKNGSDDSSAVGLLVGILLTVVVVGAVIYFAVPSLNKDVADEKPTIEITLPSSDEPTPAQ